MSTDPRVVLPRYGESSLADLLPSVRSALTGVGPNVLGLPPARRYVVALVDALGWELLSAYRSDAPYLASLLERGTALTSAAPSTTAVSLASLGTGTVPGRHGVVGYTMADPARSGAVLNTLSWDSASPPQEWQPYRTEFQAAQEAGIAMTSVGRRSFEGSGLTIAGLRGGRYVAADSTGQRIDRVLRAATDASGPSLVYVYDGDLDWTGHRDGCESDSFRHQLAVVDASLRRLRAGLPSDAVLLVTGDHGMVDIPFDSRVDVDSDRQLRAGVWLVAGDPRMRYLYTLPEIAVDEVVARWRQRLGEQALVLSRDEAIEAGWFGSVEDRVRPRIGDVVIASLDRIAVQCAAQFPAEPRLLGWHGSLTSAEVLVPLLLDV